MRKRWRGRRHSWPLRGSFGRSGPACDAHRYVTFLFVWLLTTTLAGAGKPELSSPERLAMIGDL